MADHPENIPSDKVPAHRRFQAYNVSLPKTGTTSIAAIFGQYRSEHEFRFGETVHTIVAWRTGQMSSGDFREYILERDRAGCLEMDSASFNHFYLDMLIEEFPDARFIFAIRDCYSWLNSAVNMVLRNRGYPRRGRIREYVSFVLGGFDPSRFSSMKDMKGVFPDLVDAGFRFWSEENQRVLDLLDSLPHSRSLIFRTDDLSDSIPAIARFLDLPAGSLVKEKSHGFKAPPGSLDILRAAGRELLEERCDAHCTNLMDRFFPGRTLDDSLFSAERVNLDSDTWDDILRTARKEPGGK